MSTKSPRDPVNLILILTWCILPLVCLTAVFAGNSVLFNGGIGFAFALSETLAASQLGPSVWRRATAAMALIGQSIAMTSAFAGHAMQLDSHMLFFALLAATVGMVSVRAIIALHHASLSVVMPSLIYPSVDLFQNLQRTVFHAVMVVLEATALCGAVIARQNLLAEQVEAGTAL